MAYNTPDGFQKYSTDSQEQGISYKLASDDEYAAFVQHVQSSEEFKSLDDAMIMIDQQQTYIVANEYGEQIVIANASAVQFGEPTAAAKSDGILPPGVKEITVAPVMASLSYQEGRVVLSGSTQEVASAWKINSFPGPVQASGASLDEWNTANDYLELTSANNFFFNAENAIKEETKKQKQAEPSKQTLKRLFDGSGLKIEHRGLVASEMADILSAFNDGKLIENPEKIFIGNMFEMPTGSYAIGYKYDTKQDLATLVGFKSTQQQASGNSTFRQMTRQDYQDIGVNADMFEGPARPSSEVDFALSKPQAITALREEATKKRLETLGLEAIAANAFSEGRTSLLNDAQQRFTIRKPDETEYLRIEHYENQRLNAGQEDSPRIVQVLKQSLGASYVLTDKQTNERYFVGSTIVYNKKIDTVIKSPIISHIPHDQSLIPEANKGYEDLGVSKEGMPLLVVNNASLPESEQTMYRASYATNQKTKGPGYKIRSQELIEQGQGVPNLHTYRDDGEVEQWTHATSIRQAIDNKYTTNLKADTVGNANTTELNMSPATSLPTQLQSDGEARNFIKWQSKMQDRRQELLSSVQAYEAQACSNQPKEDNLNYREHKRALAMSVLSPESFSYLSGKNGGLNFLEPSAFDKLLDNKGPDEYVGLDTVTGAGMVSNNISNLQASQALKDTDIILKTIRVKNYNEDTEFTNLYAVKDNTPGLKSHNMYLVAERVDVNGNTVLTGENALAAVGIDKSQMVPSLSLRDSITEDQLKTYATMFAEQISPSQLRSKINTQQIQHQMRKSSLSCEDVVVSASTHISTKVDTPNSPILTPHVVNLSSNDYKRLEVFDSISRVSVRALNSSEIAIMDGLVKKPGLSVNEQTGIVGAAIVRKQTFTGNTSDTLILKEQYQGSLKTRVVSSSDFINQVTANDSHLKKSTQPTELDRLTHSRTSSLKGSFAEALDVMSKALNTNANEVSERLVLTTLKVLAPAYTNTRYEVKVGLKGFRDQSTPNTPKERFDQMNKVQQQAQTQEQQQEIVQGAKATARRP